jgi:hypothetical protein
VAHADLFPSFQHVNNITRFSKALVTPAATAGSLWAFGECGRHGGKIASHLGAGIRHAQLTLKRPGLKKVLAQTFGDRARRNSDCPSPVNAIWRILCLIHPSVLRAILLCALSTTLRSSRERM